MERFGIPKAADAIESNVRDFECDQSVSSRDPPKSNTKIFF